MTIHIESFVFETIIGILEQERTTRQRVNVSATIEYQFSQNGYIDYVGIKDLIHKTMVEKKYLLLEEAILDLKKTLFERFSQISAITLKISKLDLFSDCIIAISE